MELFPQIPGLTAAPSSQTGETIGRVPAFDSGKNRFLTEDGAILERSDRDAVRQWFDLMLRQQIDHVPIYAAEDGANRIGIDRELMGRKVPSGLIVAEVERNVRETASYCPAVQDIRNFKVSRRGRTCHVSFTAVLYQRESLEVTLDA